MTNFAAFLLLATYSSAAQPGYPTLFFKYSRLYDGICASNNPVDPKWAEETKEKTSKFQQIWEHEAPLFFGALFEEFPQGFLRKEMTATLSVCAQARSISNPLVLNVTCFLNSYTGGNVRPDYAFADLVFHELLHTWVGEKLKTPTRLEMKYQAEALGVRAHLHLMAIQMFVYSKLSRQELLSWLNAQYPQAGSEYARAWEIVTQIEGHLAFMDELR